MRFLTVNTWGSVAAKAAISLAMAAGMAFSTVAFAEDKSPQVIVEQVTKDLFAIVKKHDAANKKSEAYYADVEKTLGEVVDFQFIAKAVMRKSAKEAKPEQVEQFTKVFKNGLIKTYAKGIASYATAEIKTLPVVAPADAKRVSVEQDVSDKGAAHKLSYTMMQNKAGEWRLVNVILNGVNLGDSFTSQFDQAMIKNNNDVDKVIATWLASN